MRSEANPHSLVRANESDFEIIQLGVRCLNNSESGCPPGIGDLKEHPEETPIGNQRRNSFPYGGNQSDLLHAVWPDVAEARHIEITRPDKKCRGFMRSGALRLTG